jgi:glycosyltransferase involved in cell wall biosynthesis
VGNRGVELLVAAVASAAAPSVATLELLDDYALVTARRLAAVIASDPAAVSAGGAAALAVYPGSHFAVPAAGAGGPPRARPAILDFATVRRLRDHAVEPGTLPPEAISAMARRAVEGGDGPRPVAPRFWIDESELEAEIRHGERARVRVRGWVLAEPMPRRVVLRVGGREVARGPVEVRRPDLLVAGTELEHDDCGFELEAAIGPLPVGRHEVVWGADGTDLEQGIGSVRVLPVLSLEIDRVLVPRSAPRREPLPVLVEGRAVSSQRSPRITVRAGGRALEVERRRRPAALDSEPDVVEFVASGTVEPRRAVVAGALEVHARAKGSGDAADRRRKVEIERLRGGERWVEIERRVGPFDPRLGGAPVAIRGVLFGAAPGTRVTLEAGGAPIAGATAVPIELAAESLGAASFAIESPALPGIDPELAELALLAIAPDGAVRRLERWSERTGVRGVAVRAGAPGIAAIPGRASLRRVVLEGELEGAERVSSLALAIDGVVRTRLGGEWLEPAEASAGPAARFHRFRFDAEMPLESGTRRFEIRVRRRLRETAVWSAQVEVPETGIEIAARLRSTDLDRLLAEDEPVVRSRLAVEGEVIGDLPAGASVRLILDGAPAASSPLDDDGSFRVSARPTPGATVEGALEVVADGAVVERSPAFRARMRPLVIPDGVARDFRSLLPRLLPAGEEALGADAGEILLRLHERDPGSSGRLRRAIAELGRRAAEAARAPGEVIESIEAAPRRLRVLFAAWEVPCERHGGGVCMVNLLRHLGERHEVTLIHAEAPGEEGLSETVRPFVREILTARREWQAPTHDPAYGTPRGLAWSQSPRLRRAIEAELASGGYDLVNYEYTEMCDHVAAAEVPALGALYELHSFGRHASAPGRFEDPEAAAAWLGETIATLAWEAGTVARRFRELVVLTRPEAEFFAGWLPGRRIWVSPIPVAVPSARAPEEATAAPLFVFVGNFIHPPNREAAERLSREIAPRVLEARPDARFVIAGPDPPVALTALARPGVIEVPGFVADLDGLLAGARAFVAPIRSGGGMRVKVLDAMARGAAVVTTALGSNGIEAVPGREILLADSTEETVAALVALAAEPERARALGRAARERVAASYGVAAMGERRDRIWRALAAAGG